MNSSCAFPGAQVQFTYNENIERDDSRSCIADEVLITGYSPCAFTQWAKVANSRGFDGKAAKKFAPSPDEPGFGWACPKGNCDECRSVLQKASTGTAAGPHANKRARNEDASLNSASDAGASFISAKT